MRQGKLAEALEKYQEDLSISRKLYEGQGTLESARCYSVSCEKVGDIYMEQGKLAEALEKYEESLPIFRKLYEGQGTPESARDYIISCKEVGNFLCFCTRCSILGM